MKIVKENINFERGQDVKKTLKLGIKPKIEFESLERLMGSNASSKNIVREIEEILKTS